MDLEGLRSEVLANFGQVKRLAEQAAHEIKVGGHSSKPHHWRDMAMLIQARTNDILRFIDDHGGNHGSL